MQLTVYKAILLPTPCMAHLEMCNTKDQCLVVIVTENEFYATQLNVINMTMIDTHA